MKQPHSFVRVYKMSGKPEIINQELMNELFGAGASVRDVGIVQCDTIAVHDAVLEILEEKNREHETVDYEEKPLNANGLIADHIKDVTFGKRR